ASGCTCQATAITTLRDETFPFLVLVRPTAGPDHRITPWQEAANPTTSESQDPLAPGGGCVALAWSRGVPQPAGGVGETCCDALGVETFQQWYCDTAGGAEGAACLTHGERF